MPDVSAGQSPVGGENKASFEQLHEMYARRLRAYIAARLGSRFHLVDDLAQDVWVEAWQSRHMLCADGDQFGTLAALARRVMARHARRERSHRELAVDFGGPHSRLLEQAPAAEDVALVRESTRVMVAALARAVSLGVAA